MESIHVRVYKSFITHITKNNIELNNGVDVIKSLVYVTDGFIKLTKEEKKQIIIETLEDITAGEDGILNTDDDLLSQSVLEGLELLIKSDMIISTIDLVFETMHAKLGLTIGYYLYNILSRIFCCSRKKKEDTLLQ